MYFGKPQLGKLVSHSNLSGNPTKMEASSSGRCTLGRSELQPNFRTYSLQKLFEKHSPFPAGRKLVSRTSAVQLKIPMAMRPIGAKEEEA